MTWQADIITLYPEAFPGVLDVGVLGKARKAGLWSINTHNLRTFGIGRHRTVDDTPAGGGAGMVLRADVLLKALDSINAAGRVIVLPTPRGLPFTAAVAAEWARLPGMVIICGRFEGVDERLLARRPVHAYSLGDFVLCGGEAAAACMIETTVRLRPGILGNDASAVHESFAQAGLEHAQFTQPPLVEGLSIPQVLRSGHHGAVADLRAASARAADLRFRF